MLIKLNKKSFTYYLFGFFSGSILIVLIIVIFITNLMHHGITIEFSTNQIIASIEDDIEKHATKNIKLIKQELNNEIPRIVTKYIEKSDQKSNANLEISNFTFEIPNTLLEQFNNTLSTIIEDSLYELLAYIDDDYLKGKTSLDMTEELSLIIEREISLNVIEYNFLSDYIIIPIHIKLTE